MWFKQDKLPDIFHVLSFVREIGHVNISVEKTDYCYLMDILRNVLPYAELIKTKLES